MGRTSPLPDPEVAHRALGFYMGFLTMMLNREEAAKTRFTAVMEFTGPAGGAWTSRVANGLCALTEERAADADLVMTQSPDTFIKTLARMHNPIIAMLTRQIKVRGFSKMGTFGKLFQEPGPNTIVEPAAATLADFDRVRSARTATQIHSAEEPPSTTIH